MSRTKIPNVPDISGRIVIKDLPGDHSEARINLTCSFKGFEVTVRTHHQFESRGQEGPQWTDDKVTESILLEMQLIMISTWHGFNEHLRKRARGSKGGAV